MQALRRSPIFSRICSEIPGAGASSTTFGDVVAVSNRVHLDVSHCLDHLLKPESQRDEDFQNFSADIIVEGRFSFGLGRRNR